MSELHDGGKDPFLPIPSDWLVLEREDDDWTDNEEGGDGTRFWTSDVKAARFVEAETVSVFNATCRLAPPEQRNGEWLVDPESGICLTRSQLIRILEHYWGCAD